MRICFIGDSTSIHLKRIISYYVKHKDDVLVLSTSVRRFDISGTQTLYLCAKDSARCKFGVEQSLGRPLNRAWSGLIPRRVKACARIVRRNIKLMSSYQRCLQEIVKFKPDVVFCNRTFPEGVFAWSCGLRPLLMRTAGQDISKKTKYPIYRQLIRNALRRSNIVVTQSRWEEDFLRRLCGNDLRIEVNLIGIDTTIFCPHPAQEALRQRYELPADAFIVVVNRYLHAPYNGWLIVKALESIFNQCSKLILFYANPLKLDASTRREVEAISSQSRQLRFIEGPVEHSEMAEIISCGDIYISFSSYDGIPNSLLEAMACGLVPVVAHLPQLREWIEDGVDGYILPQNDTETLASTVAHLYQHRGQLPDMAARCVEKIRSRASYETCSEKTRNVLKSIAGRP